MNLVERLIDGVQSFMNVNSATLSGAVDIIVVPQEDGTLASTSFHVKVYVNGSKVSGLKMVLGRAGEAYFVHKTSNPPPPEIAIIKDLQEDSESEGHAMNSADLHESFRTDVPTSLNSTFQKTTIPSLQKEQVLYNDSNIFASNHSLNVSEQIKNTDQYKKLCKQNYFDDEQRRNCLSFEPSSQLFEEGKSDRISRKLSSSLPTKLTDFHGNYVESEKKIIDNNNCSSDTNFECQNAPQTNQLNFESTLKEIEMSLCGPELIFQSRDREEALKIFDKFKISKTSFFCDSNKILRDCRLVFKLDNEFYPWTIAAPLILCQAVFHQPLPQTVKDQMLNDWKSAYNKPKLWRRIFGWNSQKNIESNNSMSEFNDGFSSVVTSANMLTDTIKLELAQEELKNKNYNELMLMSGEMTCKSLVGHDESTEIANENNMNSIADQKEPSAPAVEEEDLASSSHVNPIQDDADSSKKDSVYYYKSLKPTASQLANCNLKPGPNKILFVVDSAGHNRQEVESCIFLWSRASKLVVSDIDGTITRSDVLGQILPALGRDWSHNGVAELFSNIKANGYKILYLTSRSIGASRFTKEFLSSLKQNSVNLPDGPVFTSPDRLLHSINREVILGRPEIFKIQCLNEIRDLFGPYKETCFYAGFGNRETDAMSYLAVNIPPGKIFIINPLGEISGVSKVIQHSYTRINELVEQIFPSHNDKEEDTDRNKNQNDEIWNDFNYWNLRPHHPLEDFEEELKF